MGCGCEHSVCPSKINHTTRHSSGRFYVGPETNELLLNINRVGHKKIMDGAEIKLEISRHSCMKDLSVFEMVAYGFDEGVAHFEFKGEFLSDNEKYPKGFYKAKVLINDCHFDDIEIIKAQSYYVQNGKSIADKCAGETDFIEPPCNENETFEEVENECDCWEVGLDGCPNCLGQKVVVAGNNIDEEYLDDPMAEEDDDDA